MKKSGRQLHLSRAVTGLLFIALAIAGKGQSIVPTDGGSQQRKASWKVEVTSTEPLSMTVWAEDAPLAEVADELSKQVGIPVKLSPLMQTHRVTAEFVEVPFELALRSLAPQAYADYLIRGGGAAAPKCLSVYLCALNEPPPTANAIKGVRSEAIRFEGRTEEPEDWADTHDANRTAQRGAEQSLRISVERNCLTIRVRRQPLTVTLYEIAAKLGVPFDMRYESRKVIDLDVSDARLEDVMRLLPAEAQLYQRVNLLDNQVAPLRLILAKPRGD